MRAITIVHAQLTTAVAALTTAVHVTPRATLRSNAAVAVTPPYAPAVSSAMRERLSGVAAEQFAVQCFPIHAYAPPRVAFSLFARTTRDPDRQVGFVQQARHRVGDSGGVLTADE